MIPKKIFSYWHTPIFPDFIKACVCTWKKYNPEYEIIMYDEQKFNNEIQNVTDETDTPYVYKQFLSDNALCHSQKADYVRMYLIRKHGGFWIDASVIVTDSLDNFLKSDHVNGYKSIWGSGEPFLENYFFCSPPNNPLINAWLKEYIVAMNMGFRTYYPHVNQLISGFRFTKSNNGNKNAESKYNLAIHKGFKFILGFSDFHLVAYLCYSIVVFIHHQTPAICTRVADGPYRIPGKLGWDPTKNINALSTMNINTVYNNPKHDRRIIKLLCSHRERAIKFLNSSIPQKHSIFDEYIIPYYKNVTIITLKNIDVDPIAIQNLVLEHKYKRVVLLITLTPDDIIAEENMDIYGHDNECDSFKGNSNNTIVSKEIIHSMSKNCYCFVIFEGKIYYKNIANHKNIDVFKKKSPNRYLYYIKPQLMTKLQSIQSLLQNVSYVAITPQDNISLETLKGRIHPSPDEIQIINMNTTTEINN